MIPASVGYSSLQGPRSSNQDRGAVCPPWAFVLDGVGGTQRGGEAAQIALAALLNATASPLPPTAPQQAMEHLLEVAQRAVVDRLTVDGRCQGATTLTMARIIKISESLFSVTLCVVGDSPVWILSENSAPVRLTPPRTPGANLGGAVGWTHLNPTFETVSMVGAGRLVLATDGVESLPRHQLEAVISDRTSDAQQCASRLTSMVLTQGGTDNTTAAVVDLMTSLPGHHQASL